MTDWPVVFRTPADSEAAVVRGLLDAHGIPSVQAADLPPSVFPFSLQGLVEIRVSVPADQADRARRLIEDHREQATTMARLASPGALEALERGLGHRFRDRGLLEQALTHTSRVHEDATGGVADNESLEFLGDAILGFVVADALYREFPHYREGRKSKVKSALVSAATLAAAGERLALGDHLVLGRGEEQSGGRHKRALVANALEAIIAAVYLDAGLEAARRFILRVFGDEFQAARAPEFLRDYKSALQERLQALARPRPAYEVTAETGPEHDKRFHVRVRVGADVVGEALGKTKKDAEQAAARQALDRLPG